MALLALASEIIEENDQIARRARELHEAGYAEAARVDVALTTDDYPGVTSSLNAMHWKFSGVNWATTA